MKYSETQIGQTIQDAAGTKHLITGRDQVGPTTARGPQVITSSGKRIKEKELEAFYVVGDPA